MGNQEHTADVISADITKFYGPEHWVEGRAEDQLIHVARFAGMRSVVAFPDIHPGKYGPVGAAFLADRIYPQLIGPDIGCGMSLFRLDIPMRKIKADKIIRRLTSLDDGVTEEMAWEEFDQAGMSLSPVGLGTIGGGNHFCEVQITTQSVFESPLKEGDVCLLVHSGSRNIGASIFNGTEAKWNDGYQEGSFEANDYLRLHDEATKWASINRRMIALLTSQALRSDFELICDSPHNFLEKTPDGWLHRKGAAKPDSSLVPLAGSRDTESFLTLINNDNPETLNSTAHGSGRKYDRSSMHGRVRRERRVIDAMKRNPWGGHIECADVDLMIEESGKAYKDSGSVMNELESHKVSSRLAVMRPVITYKTGRTRR